MAHAPLPTTTIDGVDVFASAASSALPRHAWLAVEFFEYHGTRIGSAMFEGDTREAVARRCTGSLSRLRIIDVSKHEWRSTPYRKSPWG